MLNYRRRLGKAGRNGDDISDPLRLSWISCAAIMFGID
ncbi:hypothetical protein X749_30680 [Mesorhizobium sp. LNJC391B00]|nr:hypothetical protein X749_30680 [Mesorhizobium sp. LNJC391B00]